jgi:hypothetical protein
MWIAAIEGVSLLQSGVVAAIVAGVVSTLALVANARRATKDRQRLVFADAFEAVVAYREFAYVVRRRVDDSAEEHARISSALSEVQTRIASLEARVRIEASTVGVVYSAHVRQTRAVAGKQIRAGWDSAPLPAERTGRIDDVDYAPLHDSEERFIGAVKRHLAWWRFG